MDKSQTVWLIGKTLVRIQPPFLLINLNFKKMREVFLILLSISVGFSGLLMGVVWLTEYRSKRIKRRKLKTPIELKTGDKIYFFEDRLISARVVMNFREEDRLFVRTLCKDKKQVYIDYSKVLEIA